MISTIIFLLDVLWPYDSTIESLSYLMIFILLNDSSIWWFSPIAIELCYKCIQSLINNDVNNMHCEMYGTKSCGFRNQSQKFIYYQRLWQILLEIFWKRFWCLTFFKFKITSPCSVALQFKSFHLILLPCLCCYRVCL